MELFDSHCHLDDEKFDVDRKELIRKNIYDKYCKFNKCRI